MRYNFIDFYGNPVPIEEIFLMFIDVKDFYMQVILTSTLILIICFSCNLAGLPCTSNTAKKLADITFWKSNTNILLFGLSEMFNISDFCVFVKKGFCKEIRLAFVNTSDDYKNEVKAVVKEMKKNWSSQIPYPNLNIYHI